MCIHGLTLSLEMPAYAPPGQPITLLLHLLNNSQGEVDLMGTEPVFTAINILDSHGKQVELTKEGIQASPMGDGGSTLKPGEKFNREINLKRWFKLDKEGRYQVVVERDFVYFTRLQRYCGLTVIASFDVSREIMTTGIPN
jgi:hypothetical protein